MLVNVKRARAIFRSLTIPEFEIESGRKKIYKIAGESYQYEIIVNPDFIKVKAFDKAWPYEYNNGNVLFESPVNYQELDGSKVIVFDPYLMFDTTTGNFMITIKKHNVNTRKNYYYNFPIE